MNILTPQESVHFLNLDIHLDFPGGSDSSLPAMQKTWIWSLGQEELLEKEMETHSCILAWEIPPTEGPGGLQSMGSPRVGPNWSNLAYTQALEILLSVHFQS